jgi:hypothetical protein
MAISISRVGKLIIGDDGYVRATLASIEMQDTTDEKGRERTQLEYIFKVPTTKGTADKYLWTGLNVNSEKTYFPIDPDTGEISATGEYNKLTQLLLALGLLTELQLHSGEDIDIDIESLIGKEFKFQVIPNRKKPNLSDIDLRTIRFVDSSAATKKLTVGTKK